MFKLFKRRQPKGIKLLNDPAKRTELSQLVELVIKPVDKDRNV